MTSCRRISLWSISSFSSFLATSAAFYIFTTFSFACSICTSSFSRDTFLPLAFLPAMPLCPFPFFSYSHDSLEFFLSLFRLISDIHIIHSKRIQDGFLCLSNSMILSIQVICQSYHFNLFKFTQGYWHCHIIALCAQAFYFVFQRSIYPVPYDQCDKGNEYFGCYSLIGIYTVDMVIQKGFIRSEQFLGQISAMVIIHSLCSCHRFRCHDCEVSLQIDLLLNNRCSFVPELKNSFCNNLFFSSHLLP